MAVSGIRVRSMQERPATAARGLSAAVVDEQASAMEAQAAQAQRMSTEMVAAVRRRFPTSDHEYGAS